MPGSILLGESIEVPRFVPGLDGYSVQREAGDGD
jgi:hypothetical protein